MNAVSTHHDLKAKVNQILCNLFELNEEDLTPDKHLYTDIGLDSLDTIDLVLSFQKEFDIKPPNEELQSIRTLSDVYQMVERYHQKRSQDVV